jgi:hypothetical protein
MRSLRSRGYVPVMLVVAIVFILALAGCTWPPDGTGTNATTVTVVVTPTAAPPHIGGDYAGSWTYYGQAGEYPIHMHIIQSGSDPRLSGTTVEGSATADDTGTIQPNGSFTITETFSGGGVAYLTGTVVSAGHLSGTWSNGGNPRGIWDVHQVG